MARSLAADSAIELDARDVHVWRIRLSAGDPEALWNVLSADERARAERFHFQQHRGGWVVARALLRQILAGYTEQPAGALRFATAEFGKPSLEGNDEIRFNLSHSGDLALVAVTRGREVGVDVEQWKEDIEHIELADYVFSQAERDTLRALAAEGRVEGFFSAWSRKEAYIKATGHGITRGLDHFDVTLTPGEPAQLLADRVDPAFAARCVIRDVAVPPGYSAAVAAELPVRDVIVRDAA